MTDAWTDRLVGRDASRRTVRAHVATVASGGGALLLLGEPGLGKTVLLRAAERHAARAGVRVVAVPGVELPGPTSPHTVRQLPTSLRAHGVALLELMREAASQRPLLLVVDDAQWLDPASAEVLAFVARRLRGTHAGLLVAARPGCARALEQAALDEHRLAPLSDVESRVLLDRTFPALPGRVRERVLAEADGNPMALLELPRLVDIGSGWAPDDAPGWTADALGVFEPQITALPPRTRMLLLLHALEGGGDPGVVSRAVGGDALALLAPAEERRLVSVEESTGRLRFRHPLVATTIVRMATREQRRSAHARLAAALTAYPERRAWHLAGAAPEPDEEVATQLEGEARACLRRGDAHGATRLLERSAELSPASQARARRQAHAAFLRADVTGDLDRSAQLLATVADAEPPPAGPLAATVAATSLLLHADCEVDTAHRLLCEALAAHAADADPADAAVEDALHSLLLMSWLGGRAALWAPVAETLARMDLSSGQLVDLCHRTFGDPAHHGVEALAELSGVLAGVDHERDPLRVTRIGLACVYTDRLGDCRPALRRVVDEGRDGGAVAVAINALVSSCVDDWLTGRWDEAVDLAAEGTRLCAAYGYRRYSIVLGGYLDQLVRVARGDPIGRGAAVDEVAQWAADRGAGMPQIFAAHLRTLRAIALGDFEAAYGHVSRISAPGDLAPYNPHALWVLFDLVESATATGRHDEAERHVQTMRRLRIDRISPRLRMLVDGCAALAGSVDAASARYTRALAVPQGDRWPFDRARIQLAYGEHLLRARDAAARACLSEAMATFHRLGARPWEARAAALLRAGGTAVDPPTGRRPRLDGCTLTDRERQIADLAAQGLSNRQIGERLFLSHRSVGAALYRLFPRLGITSRAALGLALERVGRDGAGVAPPGPGPGSGSAERRGDDDDAPGTSWAPEKPGSGQLRDDAPPVEPPARPGHRRIGAVHRLDGTDARARTDQASAGPEHHVRAGARGGRRVVEPERGGARRGEAPTAVRRRP